MKELEEQTYNFAVQGIGLIKSLEKDFPELVIPGLKQNIGNVSLKFMDALDAKENEDFAKNIKDCHQNAKKSEELLSSIKGIDNENLIKQQDRLINDSRIIIQKLDEIISKLIF